MNLEIKKNSSAMDINEIFKYLPHRPPFLLIDRILEYEPKHHIIALKNVTMNESFFQGHFPQQPIMPGVLILEALAQAGTVLAFKSTGESPDAKSLYLFAGIDKARFRKMVQPGDQLVLKVELMNFKHNVIRMLGVASVNGEEACSAELLSVKK